MTNIEWVTEELNKLRGDEITALKAVAEANSKLMEAKAEYAKAKELLDGIRNAIREYASDVDYATAFGSLP
jgi:uncharacterized coiled-coil DUF342 family protein